MRRFIVPPGTKVDLDAIDCGSRAPLRQRRRGEKLLERALGRIDALQNKLWAEQRHSLLIVLQGRDAAGKDSVIRHVISGINPQGCTVASFKPPTPIELKHDFLWRVHQHTPPRGGIAVFNRSHYEDVLAVRVHRLVDTKTWRARFEEINEFERLLARDNGTTILKFFLHVSKDEQLSRFADRLDDPARNWKISEADYTERDLWDAYTKAYQSVLRQTSTRRAPWFVIPADHKWFCHLAVAEILVETITAMRLRLPAPAVDLADIRRRYHAEAKTR